MTDTTPATTLIRVCAWCGRDLGSKDGMGIRGVTSGICDRCAAALLEEVAHEAAGPAGDSGARKDGVQCRQQETTQPEVSIGAVRSSGTIAAARAHGPSTTSRIEEVA